MGPPQHNLFGIPSPQTERRADRIAGRKRLCSELTTSIGDEARLLKRAITSSDSTALSRRSSAKLAWMLGAIKEAKISSARRFRLGIERIAKHAGLSAVASTSPRALVSQPDLYTCSHSGCAQTINIAVVGIGAVAIKGHLPAIRDSADFDLTAAVDSKVEMLQDLSEMQSAQSFASLEAMLEDCVCRNKINAVSLSTPPQGRFLLAMQAVAAGKHVILEKPPLACVSQLMQLDALARQHRVSLYTSWHSRAMPAVPLARAWLQGKRVLSANVAWKEDVRWFHHGQNWIWEAGGLGVFDAGINALSILTHLLETPVHVDSAVLSIPENVCTPIAAHVTLRTADQAEINCEFDWTVSGQDQEWDIHVHTDGGSLLMQQGGKVLIVDGQDQNVCSDGWQEYSTLYNEFAALIRSGKSFVDARPLALVSDIFLIAKRQQVEAFL